MKVYDAIKDMRKRTKLNQSFSFIFMSYSIDKDESHGPVEIRKARLSVRPPKGKVKYGEQMLSFTNLDTGLDFHMHSSLLMFYNGKKLTLS